MKKLLLWVLAASFLMCNANSFACDTALEISPDDLADKAVSEGDYETFYKITKEHELGQNTLDLALFTFFDTHHWEKYVGDKDYNLLSMQYSDKTVEQRLDFSEKLNEQALCRAKIAILAFQLGADLSRRLESDPHLNKIPHDHWAYPPKFKVGIRCRRDIFLCKPHILVLHALCKHKIFVQDAHHDDIVRQQLFDEEYYLRGIFGKYLELLKCENASNLNEFERQSEELQARVIDQTKRLNQDYRKFLKYVLRIRKSASRPTWSDHEQLRPLFDELQEEITVESRPYCAFAYLFHQKYASVGFEETSTTTDLPPVLPMILHAAQEKK